MLPEILLQRGFHLVRVFQAQLTLRVVSWLFCLGQESLEVVLKVPVSSQRLNRQWSVRICTSWAGFMSELSPVLSIVVVVVEVVVGQHRNVPDFFLPDHTNGVA